MKRRRRSRSVLAVSLFPFLAVLICTLGVLIVLLVLAVKAADSQAAVAQADVESELKTQLTSLQLQLEERQIQIGGLKDVRPDALQRLEDARATRSHFENEVRQLQQEARSLAESLLVLENQRVGIKSSQISDEEISQLKLELADAEKALAEQRQVKQQAPEEVWSIVPYGGKSGTNRRPIFVECVSDHLVIQPLDIKITQDELRRAVFPGNMLDAALLAVREYWQRYDLDGDAGRAYPLIVVRPDGARTFQLAKGSLKAWDDEFGYEIVDADKKINFGNFDSELAKEVRVAIKEARSRQQKLIEVALQRQRHVRRSELARKPAGQRRPGLTVSQTGGGFVFNGVQSASEIGNEDSRAHGSRTRNTHEDSSNSLVSFRQAADAASSASESSESFDLEAEWNAKGGVAGGDMGSGELQSSSAQAMADAADGELASDSQSGASASGAANRSLADTRGSNWALPSRSAGAVPYVRPLRVICFRDHLIIKGARGDSVVRIDQGIREVVDELVNEIWAQIESWGVAGKNGYWKPQLRISVMPGSHDRFQAIQSLMADSGILIEGA